MSASGSGHLRFQSEEELANWYARSLAEGSVSIPFIEGAPEGTDQRLELQLADGRRFGAYARVLESRHLDLPPRLRVLVQAEDDLRELVERFALSKRQGRRTGLAQGRRRHERFDTLLQVRFPSYRRLSDEFATNLSQAGMFIRTSEPPPIGTEALLTVKLPNHDRHDIAVKVVRRVTQQEATPLQAAGIGVEFTHAEPAFTAAITQLLEEYRRRPPSVLLVDDDVFFLKVVGEALHGLGIQVSSANSGYRAMRVLLDAFYELDAIILDLHMPGLDGYQLIERLRRLRGVLSLRIVVLSAAPDTVLTGLVGTHGADAAFKKGTPPAEMAQKVAALLHREP